MNGTNTFSRIECAYVEAMHHFWSNNVNATATEPDHLESLYTKRFIHDSLGFRVIDSYTVNTLTDMCNGNTTVFERSDSGLCVPLFALNYHGWYSPDCHRFLEIVMKGTFSSGRFYAGRGPAEIRSVDGKMVYTNGLARIGRLDLRSSCGHNDREKIVKIHDDGREEVLGIHDFNLVLLTKKME